MSAVIIVKIPVDSVERGEDVLENGTLTHYMKNHADDLVATVVEEPD